MIELAGSITYVNTFGSRLLHARLLRGLSQAAMADACGVAQSTIANYESGIRKNPRNVIRLAQVLDVSPAWLIMGTGPMELTYTNVIAEPPKAFASTVWPLPGIDPARIWALPPRKREDLAKAVAGMLKLLEEQP